MAARKAWNIVIAFALAVLLSVATCADAAVAIVIKGASKSLTKNIRHHIGAVDAAEQQRPRRLERRLRQAITQATRAYGYYEATFSTAWDGDKLTIKVTPGPQVVWNGRHINVLGNAAAVPEIAALIAQAPFQRGAAINHQHYDNYKQQLLLLCQEHGFLDARYQRTQLGIDLQRHEATVTLIADCGEGYRVRSVSFSGSALDQQLLQSLSPLNVGARYQKSQRMELLRTLQSSGYFQRVQVNVVPLPQYKVDIRVELADVEAHRFATGIGFGTDTGVRGRLRWTRPQVNSAGHQLSAELQASQIQQTADVLYSIPLRRPEEKDWLWTAGAENKDNEDTELSSVSLGSFIEERLDPQWLMRNGVSFENENYRQGSQPRTRTSYLLPQTHFDYVSSPVAGEILSGRKLWFTVSGSAPELGADTAFLRGQIGYKQLLELTEKHLFILRAEVGGIYTDDIFDIPSSQRFFTGGDQSVRGYDYESLAPVDANGELIGGKFLNVGSAEYSYRILSDWRVAVFADTGRAYNDGTAPWHTGAGVGVRWLSPVGQIGVDIATPVDDPEDSVRLHIFLGPPL